jgi:DNA-binding transcriptional MerR regulator
MADRRLPLDRYRDVELTLEALVGAADGLLRRLDVRPDDGRIASAPDARLVRYYQTLGVVDRPLRYDGRRAIYGYRHLLQLLSVKRLQQEGHPLHLIQAALAGRATGVLEEALAGPSRGRGPLPLTLPETSQSAPPAPTRPITAAPGRESEFSATGTGAGNQRGRSEAESSPLVAARVAPGVTLTVDPTVVLDPNAVITLVASILSRVQKEH